MTNPDDNKGWQHQMTTPDDNPADKPDDNPEDNLDGNNDDYIR
jgi:hypothetical protein